MNVRSKVDMVALASVWTRSDKNSSAHGRELGGPVNRASSVFAGQWLFRGIGSDLEIRKRGTERVINKASV